MSVCLVSAADVSKYWPREDGPIIASPPPSLRTLPKKVIGLILPDLPGGEARTDRKRDKQQVWL